MRKSKYLIIMICCLIVLVISGVYCMSYLNKQEKPRLAYDHIYVCDNPEHDSTFDKWIREELGVDWVPTYIVIKHNNIIGAIRGGIPEEQFSNQLSSIIINEAVGIDLTDAEVTNLNDERKPFKDIFTDDGLYILEISWVDCKDCIYQDENFTDEIYEKYGVKTFYRYYIRSEKEKILEKHKMD